MTKIAVRAGVVAVSAGLLALLCAGCIPVAGGAGESSGPTGASSPSAEATPDDDELLDFSFAGGADLAGKVRLVEWAVPLAREDRFAVLSPDNGNGSWSFTDTANQCRLTFFQGALSDVPTGADDRTSTDAVLLTVFGANDPNVTAEVIAQYTEDASVPLWGVDGSVDVRVFGGSAADGASQADVARRFAALGTDLYLSVSCPGGGQDAFAELQELIAGQLIAIAAHPAE